MVFDNRVDKPKFALVDNCMLRLGNYIPRIGHKMTFCRVPRTFAKDYISYVNGDVPKTKGS